MNKGIMKVATCCLVGTMAVTSFTLPLEASAMSSILPVAGIARALNEGRSVTAVKADKIKSESASANKTTGTAAKASENEIEITGSSESVSDGDTEKSTVSESTIKDQAGTTDPAIITVGAASLTNDSATDGEIEITDDASLADVTTRADKETVTEDFTNLVIAQVNDYVNVREQANEESEVVGKLYNHSVGDLLETEGDWIKIKSGNTTGYVKAEYVVTGDDAVSLAKEVGKRTAVVTTTTLYVRAEASTESEVVGMVPIEDELSVLEELEGWVKVSIEEGEGYVSTDYVTVYTEFVKAESKEEEEARLAKEEEARKAANEAAKKASGKASTEQGGKTVIPPVITGNGTGSAVAGFATQFVGNPYVYGGTSLTNGTDCSGFVMSVYRNFGVSLPHSSGAQRGVGYDVGGLENAQPGDIVCYSGHVGIYIGGGQIVHASTAATGIKISTASYRNILSVRRIF